MCAIWMEGKERRIKDRANSTEEEWSIIRLVEFDDSVVGLFVDGMFDR